MFSNSDSVAINFSDRTLEMLQLQKSGSHFTVAAWSRLRIPADIIEDGKIISLEQLKQAVRQLLDSAQPGPIKPKEVVFSIPESKVFTQTLSVSDSIQDDELKSALAQKALENIPVESEFLLSDFVVYPGIEKGTRLAFYAATYRAVVDDYVKLFQSLDIRAKLITLESCALAEAVVEEKKSDVTLLLDIGSRTTNASVAVQGKIYDTATISIAGDALTAKVAAQYSLDIEQAESRKFELALQGQLDVLIEPVFGPLISELEHFIAFVTQKFRLKIGRILLAGGTAVIPSLSSFFEKKLNTQTALATPLEKFKLHRSKINSPAFLPVLGSALIAFHRKDDYINFTPIKISKSAALSERRNTKTQSTKQTAVEALQPRKNSPRRLIVLAVSLLAAAGVFGFSWWQSSLTVSTIPADVAQQLALNEINVSYEVDVTNSGSSKALDGQEVEISLDGSFELDDVFWQKLQKVISDSGVDISNSFTVYLITVDELSRQLWTERTEQYSEVYAAGGYYLVPKYATFSASSTQPTAEQFVSNIRQNMDISVNYKILLVDHSQYTSFIEEQYQEVYGEKPNAVKESVVTLQKLSNGNYKVTELLSFK